LNNRTNISSLIHQLSTGQTAGLSVYFIGIGGIGMSALARYFNSRGVQVSGYDKTPTPLTKELEAEGMAVHYEDNRAAVDTKAAFVVYTPAIPADHQELNYFLENGYSVMKRSEVLGLITSSSFNVCVAGTHGKTTTSSMIAHILRHSGYGCNAFLGGIVSNYNTNFWTDPNNVCVAEADEYDRSFLQLSPDIAVITAVDPDHLDIYDTEEKFREGFADFSAKIKPGGWLVYKYGLNCKVSFQTANQSSYDVENVQADSYAVNIKMQNGSYFFDASIRGERIDGFHLNMGGLHNVENAIAAIAAAKLVDISNDKIRAALSSFRGVKRRFEYIIHNEKMVMIDDYAHHPQELKALITSAKNLFPDKKCTVVFQPHLFTRTRDFATGFAEALGMADEVYLLPIYPARELPIEGVNSQLLADLMHEKSVVTCTKEELLSRVRNQKNNRQLELLITAGAGDIDRLVEPLQEILNAS